MLIVLPVCASDLPLALLNLQLAARLDKHCPCAALLSAPSNLDITELIECSKSWFTGQLLQYRYDDWGGDRNWPRPQNWAWQQTARYIATLTPPQPWLWWEADATPLKRGWFAALDAAYLAGAKPFAGHLVGRNGAKQQTSGVALYPADVRPYSPNAFLSRSHPFDCVLATDVGPSRIHPLSDLIGHYFKPPGRPSFKATPEKVAELLASPLVLYHGSSDGSLVHALLERQGAKPRFRFWSRVRTASVSPLTVIITNYQRPDHLWRAFESCLAAGVTNLVVSSSGASDAVLAVHKRIATRLPSTHITSRPDDAGCNEMWLRGVEAARTPFAHLLHDDDLLLPAFSSLAPLVATTPAPFYCWNAARHGAGYSGVLDYFPHLSDGLNPTDAFWPMLLTPGGLSISPVAGLFPRSHLLSVLEECARGFTTPRHFLRPSMMVGNDLLIWLRAADAFPRFHYLRTPLISFGHWEGSATFRDVTRRENKLPALYDAARDHYLHGPESPPAMAARPFLHVRTAYGSDSPAVRFAQTAWNLEYTRGNWQQCLIADDSLPRLFADNKRRVPYLKDMVAHALRDVPPDAILVFANSDIIPAPGLTRLLLQCFATHEAAFAFRRDLAELRLLTAAQIRTDTSTYSGLDLFAFTPRWWREHSPALPDLLFATELWDYTLRLLMETHGGARFHYLIYHQSHEAEGMRHRNYPSQLYNRRIAEPFLKAHGGLVYWKVGAEKDLWTLYPR